MILAVLHVFLVKVTFVGKNVQRVYIKNVVVGKLFVEREKSILN